MKKRLYLLLSLLLIAALIVVFVPHKGSADLGDFSGGGDYGGGGGGYDGGSYGGSDYGYYGGTTRSSGSDDCTTGDVIGALVVFAVVFVAVLIINLIRSKKQGGSGNVPGATRTAQSKLTPIEQYKALDENFSPEDLKEHLRNLYFKMQDCCTKRDVEPIRPYFADVLYQQFDRQMQQLKAAHRTNYVERIAVLNIDIKGYYQDKGEDVIIAELYTRITDYTLDDDTGKVLAGSKTREKFMTYEYALSRPIGKKTEAFNLGVTERHCPNCGAPLSVNESIKCPYCGSVLTFGDHDWTVYSIKGISQRTV